MKVLLLLWFSVIGERVAITARGVISCGFTGVSASTTVTAVIARGGTGPIATVGAVTSATGDVRGAISNVGVDGDDGVVSVADIRGISNVATIVANVVNCGNGSSVAGSFLKSTAATVSTGGIAKVFSFIDAPFGFTVASPRAFITVPV